MFQMRAKRQRTNSINDNTFASNLGKQPQSSLPMGAFAALSGMSNDDDAKYRVEAKRRGMSDVDDTNIKQLQENTTNMIQAQLSRMASTNAKHNGDIVQSPTISPSKHNNASNFNFNELKLNSM